VWVGWFLKHLFKVSSFFVRFGVQCSVFEKIHPQEQPDRTCRNHRNCNLRNYAQARDANVVLYHFATKKRNVELKEAEKTSLMAFLASHALSWF